MNCPAYSTKIYLIRKAKRMILIINDKVKSSNTKDGDKNTKDLKAQIQEILPNVSQLAVCI